MTYFVVPVVVTDGVGPVEAFRRSTRTIKETWGTALVGSFSMGIFAFLLMIPVVLAVLALPFLYATGRVLPENVDTYRFAEAFRPKE